MNFYKESKHFNSVINFSKNWYRKLYEFVFINMLLCPTFKNKYIFEKQFFNCLQFEFSRRDTMNFDDCAKVKGKKK